MTNDIFSGDQSGNEGTSALEALVGEGKKFTDAEALAKGKQESDAHIKTLEEENAALKAAKEGEPEGKTISDLIDTIKASQQTKPKEGDQPMSDEELQEKVRAIVSGDSAVAQATTNRELGNSLVLSKVGGDVEVAKAYVAEKAAQLGMTPESLATLSEQSPKAFAELMGLDSTPASKGTSTLPGINTQTNLQPNVVLEVDGHKTKAHYDELRKKMGVKKWLNDTALQSAMARDATALGAKFNNP